MKQILKRSGRMVLAVWITWAAAGLLHAEDFGIAVGDTVSEGNPGLGAGRLSAATETDFYNFNGTAGELVFFDPISQDPAFQRNLRWQLLRPSGTVVFGTFFSNPLGRIVLPETGQYKIRLYTDGTNPSWVGPYSFRLLPIPPDQTFPLTLGTQVSDGTPSPGAGRLEVAGAEDNYIFTANAGQLAFFEPLSQDAAFERNLRWQLQKPSGGFVFIGFFQNIPGRILLPEGGQYRLRVYTDGNVVTRFGGYSFRVDPIAQDQTFAYTIGNPVSDGVPGPGAGRLEAAGIEDNYVFTGTAGQIIFFESISQDAAFAMNLRWALMKPSGGLVFGSFFSNPQGRTVLPENGEYRIRMFTDGTQPKWFGSYSFTTRGDLADQQFPIRVGDVISDGTPTVGAGRIESPGSEDSYTFNGRAGQFVFFESLQQATAFQMNLRWELTKPSGGIVFSGFFSNPQGRTLLPEAGTYKIRVFTTGDTPAWIGNYSFRTLSPVKAGPDSVATQPGNPLLIPLSSLLCNDTAEEASDVLSITLPFSATSEGGTVTMAADGLRYTPRAGFTGLDRFTYRLQGAMGGTNQTTVTVAVTPDAGIYATVVNWHPLDPLGIEVCLLGDPLGEYVLESSVDLTFWEEVRPVEASLDGVMTFQFDPDSGPAQQFFRARRRQP